MPTLVDETEETHCYGGETAGPSGVMWLAQNLGEGDLLLDGSTVSGSFLESTLEDMRRKEPLVQAETQLVAEATTHTQAEDKTLDESNRSLSNTFDDDDLQRHLAASNLHQPCGEEPQLHAQKHQYQSSQYVDKLNETASLWGHNLAVPSSSDVVQTRTRRRPDERAVGSNEQLYVQKYGALVSDRIQAFRTQHPGQLTDYRSLSDADKLVEQQRVVRLLQRLNISAGNNKENHLRGDDEDEVDLLAHRSRRVAIDKAIQSDDSHYSVESYRSGYTGNDQSRVLLSPFDQQQTLFSPIAAAVDTSVALLSPLHPSQRDDNTSPDTDENSSTQSVELARADHRYDSPETVRQHRKRLASTSGKRGADLARARLDDGSSVDEASSSKGLVHSIGRLSIAEDKIFTSSQSPIAPRLTQTPLQQDRSPLDYAALDISFGHDDDSDVSSAKSRPVYDNVSLIETAMQPDKRVRWDFDGTLTKEAPTDVRLMDGKTFHWPKLPTERRQREAPPTQSFPDPLSFYPDKLQRRLSRLYNWLLQRDQSFSKGDSIGCAVVLSVAAQHTTDLILKFHLDSPASVVTGGAEKPGALLGRTLIVARSKEELESWGRSFREGSACSVLNHAALPMAQRKSLSSADKSALFDVVLTTYDALKSSDVTVSMDEQGFAINTKIGVNDGWYSSSSQTSDQVRRSNKQFSVLHRVNWRRLILIDILGRKSYLAKSGTARVQAIRALNADARTAFFVTSDSEEATGFQALLRSNRSAMSSLSSIFRLADGGSDETTLREIIVDFQNKSTNLEMNKS